MPLFNIDFESGDAGIFAVRKIRGGAARPAAGTVGGGQVAAELVQNVRRFLRNIVSNSVAIQSDGEPTVGA